MSYAYYVDKNGKVTKNKKKKKQTEFAYTVDSKGKITKNNTTEDIAPVKSKKKEKKDTWFKAGGFSDGVDSVGDFFGDLGETVVGTVGDVGVGLGKGLTRMGEGIGDALRYGVAGVADLTGNDNYAERLRKSAKENDTDDIWRKAEKKVDKNSVLGNKSDKVTEGLGQVAGIILTGGAAGALGAGAGVASAITTGTVGISGIGSGISEAYQSGATDKQAYTYGTIAGVGEALTELVFGGLGKTVKATGLSKGLSSADDMLAKKVSGMFNNQIAKNFAEFGIKSGAEGTEEVLSGIISAVGKKVTYMEEEELSKILEDEDLLEQFVVGSITSGIAQSGVVPAMKQGSLIEANKQGKDFITGLTTNEQKVVDKEFENRISEAEKDGKKLSEKDKTKIYDEVLNDLDKGYISTDTIESALGDKTYETYKTMEEQENSLKKEIESLENTPDNQFTVKQRERLTELREELAKIDKTEVKNQLSSEVSELAKVDRLSESYNEKARRSEAFKADLSKYDTKQQEVIKRATESGILNNTNRTHEFVDMVAKISADKGVLFDFTNNQKLKDSGFAVEGKTVNGYVKDGNIAVNIDSSKSLNTIVGHEITHVLEGTELYTELQEAVKQYATTKGDYDTRIKELSELYKDVKDANIEGEVTADLVGDYLFTDKDFVNNLSVEKPNIFKKIFNEIKYLYKMATAGSKEARQLEKVKRTFENAYKETTSKNNDTKYSFSGTRAKTANSSLLLRAEHMLDTGVDSETIRQETGWFKGYDGRMRFEIDDSQMEVYPNGDATFRKAHPEYVELEELKKKKDNSGITAEELDRLNKLDNIWGREANRWNELLRRGNLQLENILEHDKLYESYPELKDIDIEIASSEDGFKGQYNRKDKTITINEKLLDGNIAEVKKTLIHEIQHAIQHLEGFSRGSSPEYWQDRIDDGEVIQTKEQKAELTELRKQYEDVRENEPEFFKEMNELEESTPTVSRGAIDWDTLEQIEEDPIEWQNFDKQRETLEQKYGDEKVSSFMFLNHKIKNREERGISAYEAYRKTAGEIEARDTANRLSLNEEQRKATRPDIDREAVVYSDNAKYSLSDSNGKELTKEQQDYFKDSKMRDDNGNLLVMYHGSRSGGFTVFDPKASDDNRSFFFSDKPSVASSYSDSENEIAPTGKEETKGLYKTYLNLKNPYIVDANGNKWNNIVEHKEGDEFLSYIGQYMDIVTGMDSSLGLGDFLDSMNGDLVGSTEYAINELYIDEDTEESILTDDEQTKLREIAEQIDEVYNKWNEDEHLDEDGYGMSFEDYVRDNYNPKKTRQIAKEAQEKGYDGVIFKNLVDVGKFADMTQRNYEESTVAVAFDSNQIKSTANVKPTTDDDIRYSLSADSNGRKLSEEQKEYFKDTKVVDENGNLKVMYHGTSNGGHTVFDTYGSNFGLFGQGSYFTDNKSVAESYTNKGRGNNKQVYEVYLNITNPMDMDAQANIEEWQNAFPDADFSTSTTNEDCFRAMEEYFYDYEYTKNEAYEEAWDAITNMGYDGLTHIGGGRFNKADDTRHRVYIAYEPEQVKNIDNTKPTSSADIRFSLSKKGEQLAPYGNFNIYGKDVALQPKVEDAAPVQENVEKGTVEEKTNDVQQSQEEFEKLVQSYMDDAPAYMFDEDEIRAWAEEQARQNPQGATPTENTVIPESPLEERDIYTIGRDRKTNAYMYENPEVKPFFQEEAQKMLWELENSTDGKRGRKGASYGLGEEIGAFEGDWYGTKRQTSDELAYLRDNFKYDKDDLTKGLKAIIEDHGAENNAISKRIEFMLDERLREGYKDFMSNERMPANQDYINLLNEKQITEYNDEAFSNWVQTLKEDSIPTDTMQEDIAPIQQAEEMQMPTMTRPSEPNIINVPSTPSPDGKQRKWVGTSTESEPVGRKILPKDLDQNSITYEPISNKKTLNNANARLERKGYDKSVEYFNNKFEDKKISLDDIVLGERLIQEAVKKGDMKTAGELIQNVAILGTELGQKVQALSIIQRLTPEGQLKMLTKVVERGKDKGDKTFEGVEITQEMIDHILKTYGKDGTYNQDELNQAVEEVKQKIADQMKVTTAEKINAWRYLSMLGNAKTHGRNLISNVGMKGTMAVKDAIARIGEAGYDKLSKKITFIAPIETRTKTWKVASKDVKEFAKQTTKEMKKILAEGSKHSETTEIKAKRQMFKNKVLNNIYEFNSNLLSKEDWWFQGSAFNKAFSEYLTANGIETKQDIEKNAKLIEKAKAYATEQSEIATFKQYSYLANLIKKAENHNTVTGVAVGALLPFKQTPINIAKAGLNYSPIGAIKSLSYDAIQVKKGNMEASQMIDNLSQGLTGTGLALAGYMLAMSGFLNGAGKEDKEGKFDYQLGKQTYSVNIGGKTYSLSWLTPMAMPLFVGANAFEILTEGKEWDGNVVIEGLAQTLDPMSEMSLVSGIMQTLNSFASGGDMGKLADMGKTTGQNYVGQFIPTISSQLATFTDDKQRSTKVAGDSDFKYLDETVNKLKLKIPGLRQTLEPSTDVWGNEVKLNENKIQKAFDTFIAPYSRKENTATQIDEELKDLYSETGDGGLFPQVPKNSVNYDGEKYNMSAKEYTSFKKTYGQNALDLMEELFRTTTYQNASSADKAEMVDKVYDYANDEAKREYLAQKDVEFTNATKDGEAYYKENTIKGAIENDMPLEEFDFYNKYPDKYEFLQSNNVSYEDYMNDEQTKDAYNWAFSNPEKYTLSKAISKDVVTYRSYTKDLYNIKADKYANGKSISGSRKKKVSDYINSLDADYGEKLILFKSEYNADDTYNREIIDYLNNREDITFEEMNTILKEIGFTVTADGTIYWN